MTFSRYLYILLIGVSAWLIYYINSDKNQADIQLEHKIEMPAYSAQELTNTN
jgi:lipopolysaccharide export system protein LptC